MKPIIALTLALFCSNLLASNAAEDPVTAKMRERFIEGSVPQLSQFKLNHAYRCYFHSAVSGSYPSDEFALVLTSRSEGLNAEGCFSTHFDFGTLKCEPGHARTYEITREPSGWIGIYEPATPNKFGGKIVFRLDNDGQLIMEVDRYNYANAPVARFGPNGINRSIALPDLATSLYGACHE